jgi:hypothetical protein
MMKKKLGVSLIILTLGLFSCSTGNDITLKHDFKNVTWELYQTCRNGCLNADPDVSVTIEFTNKDLVEKSDGLFIGGGEYVISQAQDDGNGVSIYVLIVNSANWQLDVADTTLDITANGIFRRYSKVN